MTITRQEALDNLNAALKDAVKGLRGDDGLLADVLRRFLSDYEFDGWGGNYHDVRNESICIDSTVVSEDEMAAVRRWLDQ